MTTKNTTAAAAARRFWPDDAVVAFRRGFLDENDPVTIEAIVAQSGTCRRTVCDMLAGKTYRHLDHAVPREKLKVRKLSEEQVLAARRHYAKSWGNIPLCQIGKEMGIDECWARMVLTGERYSHLPDALPKIVFERRRWPPEVVLFMRLTYGLPGVSLSTFAERYQTDAESIRRALLGESYKDVPGALDALKPPGWNMEDARNLSRRGFDVETVKEMRAAYHPVTMTTMMLSERYGVNHSTIADILVGRTYKEVPGALPHLGKKAVTRLRLPDETVIAARNSLRGGFETQRQIAARLGIPETCAGDMLRGRTFKSVPGAVRMSTGELRKRFNATQARLKAKRPLFKAVVARLPDHDERTDLVAFRKAA